MLEPPPVGTDQVPADDHLPATGRPSSSELEALRTIERRLLWLAVRMVDHANRERANPDAIKVGGHQASSASLVSVMTALYFHHLRAEDRVSVKPHASPVLHAVNYLLGWLDREALTTLRSFGGLQAYPSRTKDPDPVDFSTGSVGLGAAAPLFAAVTRRYVDVRFGPRPPSRFVSLVGDAELDEGTVWEAVNEPMTADLGNVLWVVDFNRQSLDRVVPGVRIGHWRDQFEAAGWHVIEVKYGSRLTEAFARPGGDALRAWIDGLPNERYQALFSCPTDEVRQRFLEGASGAVVRAIASVPDDELPGLLTDLGGHDLGRLLDAFAACDAVTDRPSVVFAYTVKGWGLPIAGDPLNHGARLSDEQIDDLRRASGLTEDDEWAGLPPASEAARLVARRCEVLTRGGDRTASTASPTATSPTATLDRSPARPTASQAAFGRTLTGLLRDGRVAERLVTTAPDVATTTNLAGFINRVGVFAADQRPTYGQDGLIAWREGPTGQHLELGIGEMNFFLLLGQLGLAGAFSGQPLIPIGTVYDPFVLRGLDAFIYANYLGARFVVAGTPSGVTLAPEGGAHQSTITASVGLETPGVTTFEPAYARAVDWLLCDAVASIAGTSDGVSASETGSYYLRLSTRPIDQEPFERAARRLGDAALRRQVLAGAYRLVDPEVDAPEVGPAVNLATCGAIVPEVLAAADELRAEGVRVCVVEVTSASRLYRGWRASIRRTVRTATVLDRPGALHTPFLTGAPLVTVHDAASHAMSWLGGALGVRSLSLGVDEFGESGTIGELHRRHDLDAGSIVNAAIALL